MKYFTKQDALDFVNNIPILNEGVSYAQRLKSTATDDKFNLYALFIPPILVGAAVLVIKKIIQINLDKKKQQKLGEKTSANAGFP